ncbi:peroxiredoxin [Bradyrhizobium sp. 2TAF24]|uniref:peroxiredoxin n=1 Tax=Bradyrhizobium sp. 2TAF24 TaxID=3233011 RepID=UPI003F93F61B
MSQETRKKTSKLGSAARSRTTTRATAKVAPKSSAKAVTRATTTKKAAAAGKPATKSISASSVTKAIPLVEGQAAPGFDLPRDGGQRLSLRDYAGRNLVLFFYPRADTPGCTREAMDFTRLAGEFAAHGTDVIGVSGDTVKAQDSFKNKHKLKTPLVSDEQKEMLTAYGAWGEKSMYGRTFLGILRTTVLIDGSGQILRVWRNVKVDGHADAVLEAVRAL